MSVETFAAWRLQGNCRSVDPDMMFPGTDAISIAAAERVCVGCPVSRECLDESVRLRDWEGFRAGLTGAERRRLAQSGQLPVPCARCKRPFVPSADHHRRCRQCSHVSYKKSKGIYVQHECPVCERGIGLFHGVLRPHKWLGPDGWEPCPGTGSEPAE